MRRLIGLLVILCMRSMVLHAQELLLVYDEDFKNKDFNYYDDVTGLTYGELNWRRNWGDAGEIYKYYPEDYGDPAILDLENPGTFDKRYRMGLTEDGLAYFVRFENYKSSSSGMELEANYHGNGNVLNRHAVSGCGMRYAWSMRRGYFEIDAKLAKGTGILSSFYLHGTRQPLGYGCDSMDTPCSGRVPRNGEDVNFQEIDVFETNGNWPKRLRNNIHWSIKTLPEPNYGTINPLKDYECNFKKSKPYGNGIGNNPETDIDFTADYHTYGLYWDQNLVVLLIDGDVYRYWIENKPLFKDSGKPEPLRFLDAMYMYLGVSYGTQVGGGILGYPKKNDGTLKSGYDHDDNLNGPYPDNTIPSSQMDVKGFRYWAFLPCKSQELVQDRYTSYKAAGDVYFNDVKNEINNYNRVNYGHVETGREIVVTGNSKVLPAYKCDGNPAIWEWGDQLNLVASEKIHLKPGFHAKNSKGNLPVSHAFHAKIQTCASIPSNQKMPLVNNFTNNSNSTFTENFGNSIKTMIKESYGSNSSFKTDLSLGDVQQELEQISVTVVPNPTNGLSVLTIEEYNPDFNQTYQVNIYDGSGNLVKTVPVTGSQVSIETYDLPTGIYLIHFSDGTSFSTVRLLKNH